MDPQWSCDKIQSCQDIQQVPVALGDSPEIGLTAQRYRWAAVDRSRKITQCIFLSENDMVRSSEGAAKLETTYAAESSSASSTLYLRYVDVNSISYIILFCGL